MMQFVKKYEKFQEVLSTEDFADLSRMEASFERSNPESDFVLRIQTQLGKIQGKFREKWSTFDTTNCLLGLFSLASSIFTLIIQLSRMNRLTNESSLKNLRDVFLILCFLSIPSLFLGLTFSTIILTFLFIFNLKFFINNINLLSLLDYFRKNFLKFHEIIILVLVQLVPFSNSFIINEKICLRFFTVTLLFVEAFGQKSLRPILLCVLVRLTWVFYVCREEVASFCTQTIFSTQLEKLASFTYSNYLGYLAFNFTLALLILVYLVKTYSSDRFLTPSRETVLNLFNFGILFIYNLNELGIYEKSLSNHSETTIAFRKNLNLYLAKSIYIISIFGVFLTKRKSARNQLVNSMISIGVLMSLITSQSFLSIWILLLILFHVFVPSEHQLEIIKGIEKIFAGFLKTKN